MKLGELFIQLGVKGDTKELDKTLKQLDKTEKVNNKVAKAEKALGRELTENEKKWLKNKNAINEVRNGLNGFLKATAGIATAVAGSVIAFDRMANAMFNANQQLITFQRTSGISLNTLNKYASASSLVNYNASLQGTAQSLQNVANNLWDIQMGRGDLSPYQELAFVGGKGINPFGKSLEQVIEEIRESIKTVDDLQATNIITRMGFAPEDLMMLRMTKEELAEINNMFLSPQEQEALNQYALQMKKIHLQFSLIGQRLAMNIMPIFVKFMEHIANMADRFGQLWQNCDKFRQSITALGIALGALFAFLNPQLAGISLLVTGLFLLFDDLAVYFMGGKSITGLAIEGIKNFVKEMESISTDKLNKLAESSKAVAEAMAGIANWQAGNYLQAIFNHIMSGFYNTPIGQLVNGLSPATNNYSNNINMNNNTTIHTTQPADKIMGDNINNHFGFVVGQMLPLSY